MNKIKIISYFFFDLQALSILFSFIVSLRLINNKKIVDYMQGFYWYCIVAMIVLIPAVLATFFSYKVNLAISLINLSLIFHYSYLSIFIIKVIPQKQNLNFLSNIFWIFFLSLIYFLFKGGLNKQSTEGLFISSLGLTVFCIIYYYQLFQNIPIFNLKKEPSFWIVTGVLFAMSIHIPIVATIDYIRYNPTYIVLENIVLFCYTIMHLFFIKALLCATQVEKV